MSDCLLILYDKVRQSVTSKSKSRKHGPITNSDQAVPTQIRVCDWSMHFAFAFAHNTLTHFVIPGFAAHVHGYTGTL